MARILGDGTVVREPGDGDGDELRKKRELDALNKQPRAVISFVVGGVRMEVPLKKFMDDHQGKKPNEFAHNYLVKYVMQTWMNKLG